MRKSLIFILLLSACTQSVDNSLKVAGARILSLVGLSAPKEVFDATNSLFKAAKDYTREEEYYLGRSVAAKIFSIYPASKNQEQIDYLNKIGLALAYHSAYPDTFGGYHFMILDTDQVNALSAPGGFVFVTRGLLEKMPNEDALAAVLAHEIAHVGLQHGLKSIAQDKVRDGLAAAGKLAARLNCNEILAQAADVFGGLVEDVVKNLLEKGYSRDQEYEADSASLVFLNKAGYQATEMLTALSQLNSESNTNESNNKDKSSWLNSHPGAEERKAKIMLELSNLPQQNSKLADRVARFDRVFKRAS